MTEQPAWCLCTLYFVLGTRKLAGMTGLEPAASCVTGRRSKPTELHPHVYLKYKVRKYKAQRPDRTESFASSWPKRRWFFCLCTWYHVLCTSDGGRNRARTCDLFLVREALSQLSYSPSAFGFSRAWFAAGAKYSKNPACCQVKNRCLHLFHPAHRQPFSTNSVYHPTPGMSSNPDSSRNHPLHAKTAQQGARRLSKRERLRRNPFSCESAASM